jgi:Predicted integral membrane protein
MWPLFTAASKYKKRARFLAMLWTLLIFVLCLLPGNELPDVQLPFVDKWAHLVLFGIFTLLWLFANPSRNPRYLLLLLLITVFMGWLVEYIQGHFVPGRSQDQMDTLADAIGGAIGIAIFALLTMVGDRKMLTQQ